MRIFILSPRVHANGRVDQVGDEIDVPNDEARRMIAGGLARMADPVRETATAGPSENASRARKKC